MSESRENVSDMASQNAEQWILSAILFVTGVTALWFFYSRNEILLSGDAVAHINIARRVLDSRTPGPLQLGSVWLPLPHLLTIPFVMNARMWQSGIGGSIVSLISYIAAGLGMFRLLARWSRVAAWVGTLFFALNPNLLYTQTTALNEPLYLATFIWTTVLFLDARRSLSLNQYGMAATTLQRGTLALAAAILTRYDGWFLGCICWAAVLPAIAKAITDHRDREFRRKVVSALVLTALVPTLWFAYNLGVYRNPLEFANGPYSARAIAEHTTQSGAPTYPGEDHVLTAATFFIKAAQLNIENGFLGKLLVFLAALTGAFWLIQREWLVVLLLWSPVVFYALSIAYGSVPIFLPVWWPFSYYNARYGLELLPAVAAGVGFAAVLLWRFAPTLPFRIAAVTVLGVIAATSYSFCARDVPICLKETRVNGHARLEMDRKLADVLKSLPPQSTVLAYTGAHSGSFELAGFPLRHTINEGNLHIWEPALAHPASSADYVIAVEGDPVAEAVGVHAGGLEKISKIAVDGQSITSVYKSVLRVR